MNKCCEMVELNLCTGCVGLAEEDWAGKEQCKYYQELRNKYKNGKRYDYNQIAITNSFEKK